MKIIQIGGLRFDLSISKDGLNITTEQEGKNLTSIDYNTNTQTILSKELDLEADLVLSLGDNGLNRILSF